MARVMLRIIGTLFAFAAWLAGAPTMAQTVYTYSNTTTATISETATPCTAPLVRSFVVTSSYTVSDVNIGVRLSHSYRGDLHIFLVSPGGTSVTLQENIGGTRNNLNVLYDDSAGTSITTHTASNDSSTSGPPYQRTFSPTGSLAAFNGSNALGTWELRICDSLTGDTGAFSRADLYLTEAPAASADLSLTKTVSSSSPASGASVSYTLTVSNAGASTLTATGVSVSDPLPAGFAFVSASGSGSFNAGTGVWTVGTLAPGASASITLTGTVTATAGATITNVAEVAASSAPDPDSTPANGLAGEDDYAAVSFTVSGTRVAGTPPTLTCPLTTLHDWDAIVWAAGSTSNSYAIANIGTVDWTITNPGTWLNNATYGGQSPAEQNVVNGGIAGAGQSLFQLTNMASQAQSAVTTITLPTAVPALQFRIFDVDFASGQFADRVTVTGSFNGASVTPTLTNGVANYVIGNSAYGDATSADTSGNGNVVVTFTTPVDTIVISYGNHSLAPADPGQQAIAIHDITFCHPQTSLTVDKSSSIVSDPVNGTSNPKFIPGATARYCILVTNAGSATSTIVALTDTLPAGSTLVAGSLRTGTSCAGAATVEDADAAGADESDPFGMAVSGTTLTGIAASMGPAATVAFVFDVTVN
jgi:uncharacterized repeat protein (TIGR01451 family)